VRWNGAWRDGVTIRKKKRGEEEGNRASHR
jgi:hypothetical protein